MSKRYARSRPLTAQRHLARWIRAGPAKAVLSYDIHLASDQLLKFLFGSDDAEQAAAIFYVNQEIEVTLQPGFPSATEPNTRSFERPLRRDPQNLSAIRT
jgi:hypothetical protein